MEVEEEAMAGEREKRVCVTQLRMRSMQQWDRWILENTRWKTVDGVAFM